jgi:ParB family chromosome partitioning protein
VEQITLIPLDLLKPSVVNVRIHVDPEHVRALAEDIAARGLLHPLIVRPEGGGYGVVCGRMRLEAIRLLQREKPEAYQRLFARGIPCVVKELGDREALELSLAENIRQNTLTPEEVGRGLARLYEMGLSEEEVSRRLFVELSAVRRAITLYRRVTSAAQVTEYVAASKPGRISARERKRLSRSGVATLLSVLEKKEKRGEIKPEEKQAVIEVITRAAEEKPLTTSELEMIAKRIERERALSPERLQRVVEEVVSMGVVQRVVAFRRDVAQRVEEYAEEKGLTFDEAVNELVVAGLAARR